MPTVASRKARSYASKYCSKPEKWTLRPPCHDAFASVIADHRKRGAGLAPSVLYGNSARERSKTMVARAGRWPLHDLGEATCISHRSEHPRRGLDASKVRRCPWLLFGSNGRPPCQSDEIPRSTALFDVHRQIFVPESAIATSAHRAIQQISHIG